MAEYVHGVNGNEENDVFNNNYENKASQKSNTLTY